MMKRIGLLFVIGTFVFAGSAAAAQLGGSRSDRDLALAQRNETPPTWSVGRWAGRSDFLRADIELSIGEDGRTTLITRTGRDSHTDRGWFQNGRLDFGSDRYLIRQAGRDLRITNERNRDDTAVLRLAGQRNPGREELLITGPNNNERVRTGGVLLQGNSTYPEVQIEIFRDRDRVQTATVQPRDGHFERRFDLGPGKYEAVVRARDRSRLAIERRVTFTVGGMGRTYIESPAAGERIRSGNITITGTSEAPDVEVEIYRGRERVFVEQVRVRDGHFTSRPNLSWGTYVLTVRGKENGETIGTDKRGFEVLGQGDTFEGNSNLRLDRPTERTRYRDYVDFDGTSGGTEVHIQVMRGRDKVSDVRVGVRDGRFHTRVDLSRGHYDATIMSEVRGHVLATRRVSFDVD